MFSPKRFVLFVLSFFITYTVNCYEGPFIQYGIKDGLPNSIVNTIAQDSIGYIWFGTTNGLTRFDGNRFTVFKSVLDDPASISHNIINHIAVDAGGDIWISTRNGLNRYSYKDERFERIFLGFSTDKECNDNIVGKIYVESNGDVWIVSASGIYVFGSDIGNPQYIPAPEHWPNPRCAACVYELAELDNSVFLAACGNNGVYKVSVEKGFEPFLPYDQRWDKNAHLIVEEQNYYWVASTKGLEKITRDGMILRSYPFGNVDEKSLMQLSPWDISFFNHQLWVATFRKGLGTLNTVTGKFTWLSEQNQLLADATNKSIKSLFKDSWGNLWVGTQESGVILFKGSQKKFKSISTATHNSLSNTDGVIMSVYKDSQQNLWLGNWDGGLVKLHSDMKNFIHYPNNLEGNYAIGPGAVGAIAESDGGNIWLVTWQGRLCKIDQGSQKVRQYKGGGNDLNGWAFRTIHCESDTSIYLGSIVNGVEIFNPVTGKVTQYLHQQENDNSLINNKILSFYINEKYSPDKLWIGTGDGISCLNKRTRIFKNYRFFTDHSELKNFNSIMAFYQPDHYTIWVATEGAGLHKMNIRTGDFISFNSSNGLADNNIYCIYPDTIGNLWMSTKVGITRFDTINYKFNNFDIHDGLYVNEFKWGAHFQSDDGNIFLGSIDGLTYFNPYDIKLNLEPPKSRLKGFYIDNNPVFPGQEINDQVVLKKSITLTDTIHLVQKNNSFSIEFSGITYDNAKQIKYYYILDGFDKTWHLSGSDKATYTNLREGKYIFRLLSENSDGIRENTPVKLVIKIAPPFYRTKVAYFVYAFIFYIIVVLLRKSIISREKLKHKAKMESLRRQKEKEVTEMKLQFFTSLSHEFKTPISLIKAPLEKAFSLGSSPEQTELFQMMSRNLDRLNHLINQLLDFRKVQHSGMKFNPRRGEIVSFLKLALDEFKMVAKEKKIDLHFHSSLKQLHMIFDPSLIEKAFYNLLSNALKFTGSGGSVILDAELIDDDQLRILVIDTGIGIKKEKLKGIFKRFYSDDFTGDQVGTGIGLALTKEFVELHSGTIKVSSKVGEGSTFTVHLPVTENQEALQVNSDQWFAAKKDRLKQKSIPAITEEKTEKRIVGALMVLDDERDAQRIIEIEFQHEYTIHCFSSGEQFTEKAAKIQPDLIICDVRMPGTSGTDIVRELKSDPRTNHIPIVMLTAYGTGDYHIGSLEAGADAFLSKPFDLLVLRRTISNLIHNRRMLRKKYDDEFTENKEQPDSDQKFREQLKGLILRNLDNPSLSVELLLEHFEEGRTRFYNRVKSSTNHSVSEYIKKIRMQEARQMLSSNGVSIQEVAVKTGFKDASYFSKSFRNHFGYSPSEYKVKKQRG